MDNRMRLVFVLLMVTYFFLVIVATYSNNPSHKKSKQKSGSSSSTEEEQSKEMLIFHGLNLFHSNLFNGNWKYNNSTLLTNSTKFNIMSQSLEESWGSMYMRGILTENGTHIFISIYDGKYRDNRMFIEFREKYDKFDINLTTDAKKELNTHELVLDSTTMYLQRQYFDRGLGESSKCISSMRITLTPNSNLDDYTRIDFKERGILIQINSTDCNFAVSGEIDLFDVMNKKTWIYSSGMTLVCIITMISTYYAIKRSIEQRMFAKRICTTSLGWNIIGNAHWFLFQIRIMLERPLYASSLTLSTISLLLLWLLFQLHLIHAIYRHRQIDHQEEARANFFRFNIRFYVVLIAIVITMSVYSLNSYFLCVFVGLFWIPQIIVRVREGCKSIPNWAFIIPLTLQHSFITLYIFLYDENIFEFAPRPIAGTIIASLLFLQLVFMFFQQIFGAKFIIPKKMRNQGFQYFHDVEINHELSEDEMESHYSDCVICLNRVGNEDSDGNKISKKKAKIMQTPCGHQFHTPCLSEWLNFKQECPTCRKPIPGLEEEIQQ